MNNDKKNNDNPDIPEHPTQFNLQKISLYFLFILLIIFATAFFYITRFFIVPVLLALSFGVLFSPLYTWLLKMFRQRRNVAALVSIIIIFLGLLLPLLVILYLLYNQITDFISELQSKKIFQEGTFRNILQWIEETQFNQWLQSLNINWQTELRNWLGAIMESFTFIINRTAKGTVNLVLDLFLLLFTLFYFFRDGATILEKVLYFNPLRIKYEQMLITQFIGITRATLIGTVVIGLIHGTISAITLLIFGIPGWYLWGLIITILAFIPILGPWLILVPAGITLIILGQIWQGIILILVALIVLGLVDDLFRPWFVGHNARLHDLLILFSTLGGITVFGIFGFIIGPMIAALFITFIKIYGLEFQSLLAVRSNSDRKQ